MSKEQNKQDKQPANRGANACYATVYEEIRALCIQMCRAEASLRIVKNEDDNSTEAQPDADEFLKMDEKRLGRDFKLYAFMAEINDSIGFALADFAEVIIAVKNKYPTVFESVRKTVNEWDRFFEHRLQDGWRNLWM